MGQYACIRMSLKSFLVRAQNASVSSSDHPSPRPKCASDRPSSPPPILAYAHAPSSLNLGSLGHVLVGHLRCTSTMSTKPASARYSLYRSTGNTGRPLFCPASMQKSHHCERKESGWRVPSSERAGSAMSCISR